MSLGGVWRGWKQIFQVQTAMGGCIKRLKPNELSIELLLLLFWKDYIWQIFGWQRPINQQILNCCLFSKFFYPQKFVWEIIAITSFAGIWWREKVLEGVAFFSHFLKLIFYEIFSQRQWNLIYSYFSFELKDQEHSTSQNVKFTLRNFSLEEITKLSKITLLETKQIQWCNSTLLLVNEVYFCKSYSDYLEQVK